ncbi:MAG: Sll0314/Alr1548 family TPR repeat-containing protein [Cyanobacteria bacterium P01_D01_bin.123]
MTHTSPRKDTKLASVQAPRSRRGAWRRWLAGSMGVLAVLLQVEAARAADPFRTGADARPIGPEVEAAFDEYFCRGNYTNSRNLLMQAQQAEPNEPIVYALLASVSYQEGNLDGLAEMAVKTRETAAALEATDPLRGNLYEGIGYALEAAHRVLKDGVTAGLPRALPTLNKVFAAVREAAKVDPTDPELNLLSGYIDLILTRREKALKQFNQAAPAYLAFRGQALTLRDMDRDREALTAIDKAIEIACDNPELYYLKAQLLNRLNDFAQSLDYFNRALEQADGLPSDLVAQMTRERDSVQRKLQAGN